MREPLMYALVAVVTVVAALSALVVLIEPRLLFYPVRELDGTPADRGWSFEDVRLRTADGATIHGWHLPAPDSARASARLTLLFFHGNAGNVSHRLDKLRILRDLGLDVLIVDYRGYGRSEGRPSETGLHLDARAAYDHLVRERGVNPADLLVYGESLGSAIAARLAADVPVAGLVLESAFTSAVEVGQGMYPFLPVRWLMRNRLEVERTLGGVHAPLLVLHSRDDEYFPMRHAERLRAAAAGPARLVELHGGHNDAYRVSEDVYRAAMAEFVAGH